jgi:hypothetical protein
MYSCLLGIVEEILTDIDSQREVLMYDVRAVIIMHLHRHVRSNMKLYQLHSSATYVR